MSDFQSSDNSQADGQTEGSAVFNIQRMYLKDASLELPNSPRIFLDQTPPAVEVALAVGAEPLAEGIWEVTVTSTVTAKIEEKVLFLVECKQAGIFQMANIPLDQLDPIIGVVCPGIIYPYLRANVSDLLSRTGLPPVTLNEINFEAFYQQRLAARQLEQQSQLADASPSLQ
ncbi:protein-export chaperone SecB [soil metagenome]